MPLFFFFLSSFFFFNIIHSYWAVPDFHLFLSCAHLFQLTFHTAWISHIALSIHKIFGRPTGLEAIITPWPSSANELHLPRDRRLSTKLGPTFADKGCRAVSATNRYGSILDFLNRLRLLASMCVYIYIYIYILNISALRHSVYMTHPSQSLVFTAVNYICVPLHYQSLH
jgi:hypothetical protein